MPGKSILIVEDEGLIALHLTEILEKAGYTLLQPESSGEKVIDHLATTAYPDLILMDIGLSGKLDGIETARRIRRVHDIPIIFLTAFSDEASMAKAKEVSPHGYLVKPCEEKDLIGAIEGALGR